MTTAFLVFRLQGVLSGFGAPALGELRPAADAPGKSAVLGLLAAGLGLRRKDAEGHLMLRDQLAYAVRIDRPGALLQDFHTAQTPLKPAETRRAELQAGALSTVLSQRGYCVDAAFTVAVWLRSAQAPSLAQLAEALSYPRYSLYLGRKSCPLSAPPRPRALAASGLRAALALYDQLEPDSFARAGEARSAAIWADADAEQLGELVGHRRLRRDEVWNRPAWLFRERLEVLIEDVTA